MTMRIRASLIRRSGLALVAGAALTLFASAQLQAQESTAAASNGETVVATVDGHPITQNDVQLAVVDLADLLQQIPPAQQGEYIISFLIDIALVSKQAAAEGLDESDEFERQMQFARNKALVQAKLRAVGEAAVTDEAIQARYDEATKDFQGKEEVRARHILVKTEEEAKALLAQLREGASFEELAAEHSGDGSSQNGGDLGYFTQDMMVAPFGEVAFATAVGEISDPVKTQFGWHLIKVEDKRMSMPPKLEEVREGIARELSQLARRDYVESLRENAEIERQGGASGEAEKSE